MSIQSEIDRLMGIKADLKSAINGSGSTVGDVFGEYPTAITSGKSAIAQAITDKGVTTAANATFQQMATNIGQIETGSSFDTVNIHVYVESTGATIKYLAEDGIFKTAEINLYTFMDFTAIKNSAVYVNLDYTSLVASFSGNILGPSSISGRKDANVIMQGDIEIMIYPGD